MLVDLESLHRHFPPGMAVPALLDRLGGWLADVPPGELGYVAGVFGEAFPAERISDDGIGLAMTRTLGVFMALSEGSRVALWNHGGDVPAVVRLGADGDLMTLAPDLETFLVEWSRGIGDLEDLDPAVDAAPGHLLEELAAWLDGAGVMASVGCTAPDLGSRVKHLLDESAPGREAALARLAQVETREVPAEVLNGLLERLGACLGSRSDAPEVVALCTALGLDLAWVPGRDEFAALNFPRAGITLSFDWPWTYRNERLAAQYPRSGHAALREARVRLLGGVVLHAPGDRARGRRETFVHDGFPGPLPAGVDFRDTWDDVLDKLGPPQSDAEATGPTWYYPDAGLGFTVTFSEGPDGPRAETIPRGAIRSMTLSVDTRP